MIFRYWPCGRGTRLGCFLLVVVVAAVAAAGRSRPARRPEPATVRELVDRLRAADIPRQVISVMKGGGPEAGVFLCDRPRSWEELQHLVRERTLAPRWRGVVVVNPYPLAPLCGDWENNGVNVGGLSLYGDDDMLRQILAVLGR
jgi:hypothetical protein